MIEARPLSTQARRLAAILAAVSLLAACDPATQGATAEPPEPGVLEATRDGPADARPGSCWGKTVSPAVIESASQRVLVKPAKVNPDGTIASLPVYETKEQQVIVTPRIDNWFETPCPNVLTPEFISSLQRALQARGGYGGGVSGIFDPATRDAVLRFQRQQGLESAVLALTTARTLGLVAVERQSTD